MALLTAAVAVVAVLCLLNLVLLIGLMRKLDAISVPAGDAHAAGPEVPPPTLPPGETVAPFEATTTEGQPVSSAGLVGSTLVGFFSPDCFACHEQLPGFVDHAGRVEREQTLAVVVDTDGAADLVTTLLPVARVVAEPPDGPVARAFAVEGTPAFCRLDGAVVADSGFDLRALTAPDPA